MTETALMTKAEVQAALGGVPATDDKGFQTAGLLSNNILPAASAAPAAPAAAPAAPAAAPAAAADAAPAPAAAPVDSSGTSVILKDRALPAPAETKDWRESIPEQFRADTLEETVQKLNEAYSQVASSNEKAQEELKQYDVPDIKAPEQTAEEAFGSTLAKVFEEKKIDGLDMKDRFFRYEELTRADHAKLEEAGINPTLFENSLLQERNNEIDKAQQEQLQKQQTEAQQAPRLNDADTQTILSEYAGGSADQFAAMAKWGQANFGTDAMVGIQQAIDTGNINIARAAIGGLHAAYVATQGRERSLAVTGGKSPEYGLGPVGPQEAQKIFNDPRYTSTMPADRAWRAQQMARQWL